MNKLIRENVWLKHMIIVFNLKFVKVETLRAQVAQKDMFISELLDRIAIVECEVRKIHHCVFTACFIFGVVL